MLTRGYSIGQSVEDFASISEKAKMRANLALYDIHKHVEDSLKKCFYEICLSNLNAERLNNPGLDLGDETSGWAF
jgi:hypothetical protein